jgi:hypothetical protein
MKAIKEPYRQIGGNADSFHAESCQSQENQVIFKAAIDMVFDHLTTRHRRVDEPGSKRLLSIFQKGNHGS